MESCPDCSKEFETERGLKTHIGKIHDPLPKEDLVDLYIRENLSAREIAERRDMSHRTVKDRLTKYDLWGKDPAKFYLEDGGQSGMFTGYPMWRKTGSGQRLRVHRLQIIAAGADPHEVFGGEKSVDHINGCPLDNRQENLRLMDKKVHGRKDGVRTKNNYSHSDYLRALVQEPPEWAQNLPDPGAPDEEDEP